MQIQGEYSMPASVEQIWAVIFDPAFMAKVIPGCREIDQTSDREYRLKLVLGIPGIQGQYQGRMLITDTEPLRRIFGDIDATGGLGKFQGQGRLEFDTEEAGVTRLSYSAEVEIRGPMASMAGDFFEQVATQLMRQSLDSFAGLLQATPQNTAPVSQVPGSAPAAEVAEVVPAGPNMGVMALKAAMAIIAQKIRRLLGFKRN